MDLWRICKRKYARTAFSGIGSDKVGGRWNPKGVSMVYTSENASLAIVESLVHTSPGIQPPLVLIHATLPESVVAYYFEVADLPRNWRHVRAPLSLKTLGGEWAESNVGVALYVPSVISPNENNILLNPRHPDITKLKIVSRQPFRYDDRLLG